MPPSQVWGVWEVVKAHFPKVEPETICYKIYSAAELVEECDADICQACSEIAVFESEKVGESIELSRSFPNVWGAANIFRKKRAAIESGDASKWRFAANNTNRRMDMIELAAENDLAKERDITLADALIEAIGPTEDSLQKNSEFWTQKTEEIEVALNRLKKGGRQTNLHRDEAVRAAVELWETLTGHKATQPAHELATSERKTSMTSFVQDVIAIYKDYGMSGAVSINSGAYWRRILKNR